MNGFRGDPNAWRGLEVVGVPVRGEFRVLESGVFLPTGPVLYARDAEGHRHLLVPVSQDTPLAADRRSAGVHIVPRVLEDEHGRTDFVDVACRKAHLNEVFAHLVDDTLSALDADSSRPFSTCRRVLARWRELLEREAPSVLSMEVLAGLFGELWHLRELARRNPEALGGWIGPVGGRHDFARGGTTLEVKTSLRRDGRMFEIHGVDQLAAPEGCSLFLATMKLERAESGGESLPDVIQALIELGTDPHDLLVKLAAVGYDSRDAGHYHEAGFRVLEHRVYHVDTKFPRIVRSSFRAGDLPPGVLGLSYMIDLSGEPPTPIPVAALDRLYGVLSGAV